MPYKHTQIGYVMIVAMLAVGVIAFIFERTTVLWIAGILGISFSTLTVSVESERVRLWFGPGFIQLQFPISDIEFCQVSKSRCWVWGIHGWPGKGWFFNVSGFCSVELKMRNDGKYHIGTDQPEALERAIHEALHASIRRSLKAE